MAVKLNWVYLMFFLASKDYSRVSSSTTSLHSGAHSFLPDQNLTSESDQSFVDCCKMPSLQLLNCWTCLIIKRWKYNPQERRCSSGWSVCVCACAARSKTDRQSTLWASRASKRSNTHKACKNGRLGDYSLKHSLYLKVHEKSWEKIVSIFCLSDRLELLQC